MGKALLAALLKNSLRDWSSLFLFFFITLEVKDAYELPKFSVNNLFGLETKKAWEFPTFAHP